MLPTLQTLDQAGYYEHSQTPCITIVSITILEPCKQLHTTSQQQLVKYVWVFVKAAGLPEKGPPQHMHSIGNEQ